MKRHLNTLFVTTQGTYLASSGEAVVVRIEDEAKLRLPLHMLGGIVCFGRVNVSPWLMGKCAERGIAISFLSEQGRFLARVQGFTPGNVLLRREQYRREDDVMASACIARNIVSAKVANARTVLLRSIRDYPDVPNVDKLQTAAGRMAYGIKRLQELNELDIIRGIEGESANAYFDVFEHLITAQQDGFVFFGGFQGGLAVREGSGTTAVDGERARRGSPRPIAASRVSVAESATLEKGSARCPFRLAS